MSFMNSLCRVRNKIMYAVFTKSRQHVCHVRRKIQMSEVGFVKIIIIWCLRLPIGRRRVKYIREDWCMYSCGKLFMHSLECYVGAFFPRCCTTREINTKITLSWAYKQFVTRVHTLFSCPQADVTRMRTLGLLTASRHCGDSSHFSNIDMYL